MNLENLLHQKGVQTLEQSQSLISFSLQETKTNTYQTNMVALKATLIFLYEASANWCTSWNSHSANWNIMKYGYSPMSVIMIDNGSNWQFETQLHMYTYMYSILI